MSVKTIIFNREALYHKVWRKALMLVAADYGLSDNGLKKICIKMNIPIPYNGYWAKLKHGKDVFQTPLPNLKPGDLETYKLEIEEKQKIELLEKYKKLIELEENPENKIVVPEKISRLHPLVKLTKDYISKAREGYYDDFFRVHRGKIFNTVITQSTLNRAILIMNTLVIELEKRGFVIQTARNDEDWVETKILFDGQIIKIELRELSKFEMREVKKTYSNEKEMIKVKASTGILKIEIIKEWGWQKIALAKDTTKLKLEDQLNRFFIRMYEIINEEVIEKIEREKERKIEAERRKKAQLLEEERKREQDRTENLLKLADEWNKVKYINNFLDEIEIAMKEKKLLTEEKKDWLRWARAKMNSMNPINRVVL
ncbi:MAG: hypothetical protein IH620_03680 [Ignavibacterium sp.]|nr:hypothetical protein [Ignavibacterium sp.]